MADKILTELVINRGTKQKFDDLPTKSPDELYFITDTETFQRKLTAGENITIDESTNTISATGGSGSGRNIGDIFYTTRTDTALAGAVECNGGTYSTADYTGAGSIGELLAGGKLPYLSLAEYAQRITNTGNCAVFGWDGGTTFRVPTLRDIFIEATNSSSGEVNWYKAAGLPNITSGNAGVMSWYNDTPTWTQGALRKTVNIVAALGDGGSWSYTGPANFDASRSSAIYGNSNTVQPEAVKYRAMVQLFNSTTDKAVATVGTVVAQVSENTTQIANRVIKGHEVIAFQAPTSANGYTWYRKYADGWVEQGGRWTGSQTCGQGQEINLTVNLPITMSNTRYYANSSVANLYLFQMRYTPATTNVRFGFGAYTVARTLTEFVWTVAGMAA